MYRASIRHQWHFMSNESLITRARNECAAAFLASPATHLMFIDADIGFEPKAVIRLLTSGHDIAAGSYRLKCDEVRFPIKPENLEPPDEHGFIEAPGATTGFMCIHRRVFLRMQEAIPGLAYQADSGEMHWAFFDTAIRDYKYLSEDYEFCRRWRDLGGTIHIDTTPRFTHQGFKQYEGGLADIMEAKS